jgi:hypothetical protein
MVLWRARMAKAVGWAGRHPGILVLIAALLAGQVAQSVLRPHVEESPVAFGQIPVFAVTALGIALALAVLVLVVRVRLGSQMTGAARNFSLPRSESLPARYAIADPPRQAVLGALALIDVALVLLVQNTLRAPVLSIADDYVTRAQANVAYVGLVILVSLVVLIRLYRTGAPVLVLLLWCGLDRMVPTAGFLGGHPAPAVVPVLVAPQPHRDTRHDETVVAPLTTLVAPNHQDEAAIDPEATIVASATDSLDGPTIITSRRTDTERP